MLRNLIKRLRIRLMRDYGLPASYVDGIPLYAQGREDIYLLRLFGRNYKGFYVDVGANDGVFVSNTYSLYRRGWRGICLEPNPEVFHRLKAVRPEDICLNLAAGAEDGALTLAWREGLSEGSTLQAVDMVGRSSLSVEVKPLTRILSEQLAPSSFDVLSIDVEGFEVNVMKGLDWAAFSPRVIVMEYNNGGRANPAAVEMVGTLGYRPIAINRWNMIFSRTWDQDIMKIHTGQDWFQFDRSVVP